MGGLCDTMGGTQSGWYTKKLWKQCWCLGGVVCVCGERLVNGRCGDTMGGYRSRSFRGCRGEDWMTKGDICLGWEAYKSS